jgi:hypothetical protein
LWWLAICSRISTSVVDDGREVCCMPGYYFSCAFNVAASISLMLDLPYLQTMPTARRLAASQESTLLDCGGWQFAHVSAQAWWMMTGKFAACQATTFPVPSTSLHQ